MCRQPVEHSVTFLPATTTTSTAAAATGSKQKKFIKNRINVATYLIVAWTCFQDFMLYQLIVTIGSATGTFTWRLRCAICHLWVRCLCTIGRSTHDGCCRSSCRPAWTQCCAADNNCGTIDATTIALGCKKRRRKKNGSKLEVEQNTNNKHTSVATSRSRKNKSGKNGEVLTICYWKLFCKWRRASKIESMMGCRCRRWAKMRRSAWTTLCLAMIHLVSPVFNC